MPTFQITGPDGAKYRVTGPDGATEQDALAQVQGSQQPQQSPIPADKFTGPELPPGVDLKNLAPDLPWYALSQGAGMFGDLANLVGLGGKKYSPPTTEQLRTQLEGPNKEFPLYKPGTPEGHIAQGIAEALPTAPLAPGGLALKAAQTIIPPIVSEATGSPLLGAAAGIGTGIAGTGRQAARAIPALEQAQRVTPRELIDEGGRLRDAALASPEAVDPNHVLQYVLQARNQLSREGKPAALAGGAHAALDELERSANRALAQNPPPYQPLGNFNTMAPLGPLPNRTPAGAPMMAADAMNFRQALTNMTKSAMPSDNKTAAGIAKSAFDEWLRTAAPRTAAIADEANANFRPGYLGAEIANPVNRATLGALATNSGMNVENRIRSTIAAQLAKEQERATLGRAQKFTPEVQGMMQDLSTGDATANNLRLAGNLLGGGGGLGALLTGSILNPVAPFVGYGIKALGNRTTLNKADALAQAAMANSPLAQSRRALTQPQIDAARDSIRSSKLSAARKATMLQALDRVAGPRNVTAVRADEDQQ